MLAVRRFAGDYLVDALVEDDAVKPAGHEAWSILTQVLADRAWVWIVLGVVTLLGVWFVGESGRAAQARSAAAPTLESRPTTYVIAAAALLVIALVAPTVATSWVIGPSPHRAHRRGHRGRQERRPPRSRAVHLTTGGVTPRRG